MLLIALVLLVVLMSVGHHWLPNDLVGALLMSPVMVYGAWVYLDTTAVDLFTVISFSTTGIVFGATVFAAGLYICAENPGKYLRDSLAGARRYDLARNNIPSLGSQLVLISYEELIWRVFLINALLTWMPAWLAVMAAAMLFWIAHKENFPLGHHSVEFMLFSIVIASAYTVSGSILLAWFLHASRNFLIMSNGWYTKAQQRDPDQ